MAWDDRLQTAVYISPEGNRFEFIYEGFSMEVDRKTTEFTFPEKNGAYIQDLGRAGRRFPFNFFFSGPDHDLEADRFIASLDEIGNAKFEHPLYGDRIVVPRGTITRRDDLVNGANQAAFSITFSETIELTFPVSAEAQGAALQEAGNNFQSAAAAEFASQIQLDNTFEGVALEQTAAASVAVISPLEEITKQDPDLFSSFQTILASYEENVRNVIFQASDVMLQAILLTRIPGRVATEIQNQIDDYGNMIDVLTASVGIQDGTNNPRNSYLYGSSLASAALTALCESSLFAEITTRPQAVTAAEAVLDIFDDMKEWQDQNITSLEIIDPGEAYSTLLSVVTQAVAYLIKVSFDLPAERRVILQNERQMIEFLSTVGLTVEENIDNFIQWNDLTGDQIEILPKGFEAVYYG